MCNHVMHTRFFASMARDRCLDCGLTVMSPKAEHPQWVESRMARLSAANAAGGRAMQEKVRRSRKGTRSKYE